MSFYYPYSLLKATASGKKLRNIMEIAAFIPFALVVTALSLAVLVAKQIANRNNKSPTEKTSLNGGEPSSNQHPSSHNFETFIKENFDMENIQYTNNLEICIASKLLETHDKENKIRKAELGSDLKTGSEKIILLVGGKASGKTTMINGILNYIMGVKYTDSRRFKLIEVPDEELNEVPNGYQAETYKTWITAYTIHHQPWFKVPYTLTIIDTPGIDDTFGTQGYQDDVEQIKKFLGTGGENGVDHLDVLGFVSNATSERSTETKDFLPKLVIPLFRDFIDNIVVMFTKADSKKVPDSTAFRELGVSSESCVVFNNSALYANNDNKLNEVFWNLGANGFTKLMAELRKFKRKTLHQTRDPPTERNLQQRIMEQIWSCCRCFRKKS